MGLTILKDAPGRVTPTSGAILLACLPLVVVASLGDPFQAPRAVVLGLAVLALGITSQSPGRAPRAVLIAAVALAASVALSAALGSPGSSVWGVHGRFQGLVSLLLLGLTAVAGRSVARDVIPRFAIALGAVTLVESAIVLSQAVGAGVPDGTFGNKALAGAWLSVGVATSAGLAIASPGRRRAFAALAAGAGTLAMGATGTRGAWLGLAAGMVVALALSPSGRSKRFAASLAAAGVALVVLGAAMAGPASTAKLDPAALSSGSAASRLEIWKGTAEMVRARPLTGFGPGRFLYAFPQFEPLEHARAEGPGVRADNAHGAVLHLAAESGVPAALAYLALAGLALSAGVRGVRRRDGVAVIATIGLSAYLAQGLFGVPSLETDALGWFLGGVALASAGRPADERSRSSSRRWWVSAAALAALVLSAWYANANLHHATGLRLFAEARFEEAAAESRAAIRLDPLTDVYRVALADTALYRGGAAAKNALRAVEVGLEIEPDSYDLALARARLLAASGADADSVALAYRRAVDSYPLDVISRREAIEALAAAGRTSDAAIMAENLLRLSPNDPVAREWVR